MYSDKNDLLTKAKTLLQDEMTAISYSTWIRTLDIDSINDNKINLLVNSKMQKDAIESRFFDLIVNTFNIITNKSCEVKILEKSKEIEDLKQENDSLTQNTTTPEVYSNSFLNPKYTFDNFVVGNNNKFAQAAAQAVAKSPASAYNPLFIYGGVGLGKTHLMHAIGNHILSNNPSAKILYVTSEKFINELVNSIKDANYKNELFRNKYRNIDVLLIDDIQFLAGKKTGQEEFFHTFNTLHETGKQIIISSDKPPRDIPLLEERLKSRFEWGILADISMPDYETRLAILRKKVQIENIIIDDYILSVIATKIDSNIRELEGALNKIIAYASLMHSPITIEMAEKAIVEVALQKEKVISADYIQEIVSKYFNIDKKDLVSTKKSSDIVHPRQIAMYLCREIGQMSFPKIGEEFGKRDHTTVMHAYKKIEKEIKENTNTKLVVESVKNIIKESK
ncbi:MAG: chromosomal replication initiator protein DnaA [Clostridia bacterium]|nr:chromosomal replication initiator protein DnaA [Clostridia bacterium]